MSTYLDLVNKVINESGSELDELDATSWFTPDAGRRQYPRMKRLVAEAWKMIQLDRREWEFKVEELSSIVYPRIIVAEGERLAGNPTIGSVYKGQDSNAIITITKIVENKGDWSAATGEAQFEIEASENSPIPKPGEVFAEVTPVENDGHFLFLEKGNYTFKEVNPLIRDIHYRTMVATQDNTTPIPVAFVPWDNWTHKEISYTYGTRNAPVYVSEDPQGRTVFFPQTLDPFRIWFEHDTAPQDLEEPDDVPFLLEAEYHDWIAWRATAQLARFNKNPDLLEYAGTMAALYEKRAEASLMPKVAWGHNKFYY